MYLKIIRGTSDPLIGIWDLKLNDICEGHNEQAPTTIY
jgi:hypothetical protein